VAIASAITDKGVSTDAKDTFAQMAVNIERISGGGGVSFEGIDTQIEVVSYTEVN
jgi:hypothetical protein